MSGHPAEARDSRWRAERTLTELQNLHARNGELTGDFWHEDYAWRLYYAWGSLRVLETNFVDAKRFFEMTYRLHHSFEPAAAIARVITEMGLDSHPGMARRVEPPHQPPSPPATHETTVQPPLHPRAQSQKAQVPKKTETLAKAKAPPPLPPPFQPKLVCPTLLEAMREVVGPGGLTQYAGGLLTLGAAWLTRAGGGWIAALGIAGAAATVVGKVYEDFNKARTKVATCEALSRR